MSISDMNNAKDKRKLKKDFADAGWNLFNVKTPGGPLGGPTIYFCDVETGQLFVVATLKGAVEILTKEFQHNGTSYEDICNAVGSLIDGLAHKKIALDTETQNIMSVGAVLYIAGTLSYAYIKNAGITPQQFIVLRYYDHSSGTALLRPNPIISDNPLDPGDIERQAQIILELDKKKHPKRFKRAEVIKFEIKEKHDV